MVLLYSNLKVEFKPMDKKLGHFNPEILKRFHDLVGISSPTPVVKFDNKQILNTIEEASKQGLSQSEIYKAYSQIKNTYGIIDTWEKLGEFRKELESISRRRKYEEEEKYYTIEDVKYLVNKIKPLHMSNQRNLCRDKKLGYIDADAVKLFREETTQRKACQKPDGSIYRIPLNRECVQGVEVPDKPDEKKKDNQSTGRGRGRGRGRSGGARPSGKLSSIIQSLAGKLGGGGGRLTVKKIGGK